MSLHRLITTTSQIGLAAVLAAVLAAAPAHGASRLVIRGAGYGHGVGMSQYGALGYARQGMDARFILAHYYTGTALSPYAGAGEVRVLLKGGRSAAFSGATQGAGRRLDPTRTYRVAPSGLGRVALRSASGRTLATVDPPLRASGGTQPILLKGTAGNGLANGRYRGALEFRPTAVGGLNAINAVSLEDYVRGVVSAESPASWPPAALQAQAVAARTYAVTTSKRGDGFDQYPDQRSQVYRGVAAEYPSTDAAVAATAGQVVTYQGVPAVTFFFSTSGGRTEDVQNAFAGATPKPWLVSVDDPYDSVSPVHRWGPIRMTLAQAGRKLRGLVKGSFRGIDVVRRGSSPRIVLADVVGSRGRTRVRGSDLRARLGTRDTWMTFSVITAKGTTPGSDAAPPPTADTAPADPGTGGTGTGGLAPTAPPAARSAAARGVVAGRVAPARRGARVALERRVGRAWRSAGSATVGAGGRYRFTRLARGTYRVLWRGDAGPVVRLR